MRYTHAHSLRCAVLMSAVLVSSTASAQEEQQQTGSIALNQFDPSPAGDTFFTIPSPFAVGEIFEPRAKIILEGSADPLRLVQGDEDGNEVGAVVSSQLFMHINVSAGIVDRALISVLLPIAVRQSGDSPSTEGIQAVSPDSAQLGDVRIGGRVRLYGEYDEPFQIGTGAYLWVPSGPSGSFVGEGSVRVTPYLSAGGPFELGSKWWWTAHGGVEIRGGDNPSKMRYGAGLASVLFSDLLHLSAEFFASTPLQDATNFQITEGRDVEQTSATNAELIFGTRVRVWHITAGAAGGPGLTTAVGTPAFRLMASIQYSPLPEEPDPAEIDTDADGIMDIDDGCPHAYGKHDADPKRHGCPELDDDEDGVPNHRDSCPNEYGDPQHQGCAPPP